MFYCPIHKTTQHQINEVDAVVDTVVYIYCDECKETEEKSADLWKWFYQNNNVKLASNIKKDIKEGKYKFYNLHPMFGKFPHFLDSYNEYKYIDNQIYHINIYKYVNSFINYNSFSTRFALRCQKWTETLNLKDLHPELPIHLASDDEYLQNIIKFMNRKK